MASLQRLKFFQRSRPALALGAALLSAFAAAPAVATDQWTLASMAGFKPITTGGTNAAATRQRASAAVSVPLETLTTVAAWTLLNQSACTQGPTGAWSLPMKNPNVKGTWSSVIITGKLSNGACPKTTFMFNAIQFNWTRKRSPTGAIDKKNAIWKDSSGTARFVVLENMTVTLK